MLQQKAALAVFTAASAYWQAVNALMNKKNLKNSNVLEIFLCFHTKLMSMLSLSDELAV